MLNIVHGWPDDQQVTASIKEDGTLSVSRNGTASFLDQIVGERPFRDVWLGPGTPSATQFTPGPTVNYIADADLCSQALQAAVTLSDSLSFPWFNHPRAVARNTRDQVARDLQGLAHVHVPRTIRIKAATVAAVERALAAADLRYPLILRVAGVHGGTTSLRCETPSDVAAAWGGLQGRGDLYATTYVDFRSPDGRYRKFRIAVIGGEPVLRHLIIGADWLLSAGSRLKGSAIEAEEKAALEAPVDALSPFIAAQIAAIHRAVGLDYFGIDCTIGIDGTLTLFEANPTMNILFNSFPSPNMWDRPIARCKQALLALLDHPERWTAQDGSGASVPQDGRRRSQ